MTSPAAILLAFANDWVDDKRHLRSLLDESKAIGKAIAPLVDTGVLGLLPPLHNATVDDVIEAFRARGHRSRICIFHFGGHANSSTLLFEDATGQPSRVDGQGLAGYLSHQPGLVLVFLNACCTEPQVRQLRAAGVRAVVATTRAIQDTAASDFATAFYAELAARPLRDAFETAVQVMRLRWGDHPRSVTRDLDAPGPSEPGWPWVIDCDPEYETWKPGAESPGGPDRGWRLHFLLAGRTWWIRLSVAATTMLLLVTLAISGIARRTVCSLGLHSLCAAGVGDPPTSAEQGLWDDAVTQRSGEALRTYLRAYPTGAHVDEAQARLKRCQVERVESLEPAKVIRYIWTVNPVRAHPFGTEDKAREDALARGSQDAAVMCEPLARNARLLSTAVEPRDWMCTLQDHGFACGFDGAILCRIQYRTPIEREHCDAHE